ncbi:MAG: M20 family metallopeptidase [Candidatus Promineofilum sp.]|nr:M20 family metallopeptidase [Promineifilum sp.]
MTHAQTLLNHLTRRRDDMVSLLAALVAAESPSDVPETQAGPMAILREQFDRLGYHVEYTPGTRTGGYLIARHPAAGERPTQLLLGHCDTVWPVGTLAEMPLKIEGDTLRGPGSFDMKGGLAQGIFALSALRDLGLEPPLAPVFLVNTDEEIGSFESRSIIEQLAQESARALILEPSAGAEGKLKTARKGVGDFQIVVRGRASHAGLEPEKGVSAILGMARIVTALAELNDYPRGVSVSTGLISGGSRSNVVPAECRAVVDVRAVTVADAERLERAVNALTPPLAGTTLEITGGFDRPPLERTPRNAALWEMARATGVEMGLALEETAVGGGSDGNLTSPFTATLDGLGPVGDGAHASHEHVIISRMVERSALLAALLLKEAA